MSAYRESDPVGPRWRKSRVARAPKIDPARQRLENRKVLLNLLWSERTISRADIARETGLSRSTVSAIVADLLETELVEARGAGTSKGGRRPIILGFNDNAKALVGVEMGATHVAVMVTNLRGQRQAWLDVAHPVREDPQGSLALTARLVREALEEAGHPLNKAVGVGVALPSPVGPRGEVAPQILPAWKGQRPGVHLEEALGLPVFVDNDANLGAVAEHWWGSALDGSDLMYVKLATGIGAGFIVDGRLYRGAWGGAGEVGHMSIDVEGPPCACGMRGCLVTRVGGVALLQRARELAGEAAPTTLLELAQSAREGDEVASGVIGDAGRELGAAFASLLNVLDPRTIVVGGSLTHAGDALLGPLREVIAQRSPFAPVTPPEVVATELGESGIALGAATSVLQAALLDEAMFHPER